MTSVFSCKTLLAFALLHSILQGQICLLLQVYPDFLLLQENTKAVHCHLVYLTYMQSTS